MLQALIAIVGFVFVAILALLLTYTLLYFVIMGICFPLLVPFINLFRKRKIGLPNWRFNPFQHTTVINYQCSMDKQQS